ncbi:hypothetical protein ACVWYV_001289 [Pantoea eucalypti]|jgi:hypothetical protein
MQNIPSAADVKFNAKKIIFEAMKEQGKIIHS